MHMNIHTFLIILALVLGILAVPPIPSRFNLLAASWVAYLLSVFFT